MGVKEDREQLSLELINRDRLDPQAAANLWKTNSAGSSTDLNSGLAAGTISAASKQPLAFNPFLNTAAQTHNSDMMAGNFFSHTGSNGSNAGARMVTAGYGTSGSFGWAENLAAILGGSTVPNTATLNQWVIDNHQNLFRSSGHRQNMLNPLYEEIGVAVDYDSSYVSGNQSLVETQNYGYKLTTPVFITGVNYTDTDNNDFYSIGEAAAGRTVTIYNGATLVGSTSTAVAGGYSYQVAANATYEVVFSGGGLSGEMGVSLAAASTNVKVDLTDGNTIETHVTATLTRGSVNLTLIGMDNVNGTGNELGNILAGNKGNNSLSGLVGNDTLNGGDGTDTLDGGLGNDALNGGNGTDTAVFSANMADYTFTYNAGNQTYTIYNPDGSTDTATGVENFQFADGTRTAAQLPLSGGPPQRTVSISLAQPSATEGNSGTTAFVFTVSLNAAVFDTQTVTFTAAGSGANPTNGADHSGLLTGTVTFLAGETSKTVTILVVGDTLIETDETFTVTLSGPSGGLLIGTAAAVATVVTDDNAIEGTPGPDPLDGTAGDDIMRGFAGDDVLRGMGGADDMDGGDDNDWASYEGSDAGVTVNLLANSATGGHAEGDSFTSIENLIGSEFADSLTGDGGNNILRGMAGADSLSGGAGLRDVADYTGSDAGVTVSLALGAIGSGGHAAGDALSQIEDITGSAHNDTLTGTSTANILIGNDGDDTLNGGGNNDQLFGGNGDDVLAGGTGADIIDGGANTTAGDTVSFANATARIILTLVNGAGTATGSGQGAGDTITNIENITGSAYNDIFTGDALDNIINGLAGTDTLKGGAGNDELIGGAGLDNLEGGLGDDILRGGPDADTFLFRLTENFGQDQIIGWQNNTDKIDLVGAGFDFSDFTKTQDGADTLLTLTADPSQTIRLVGINANTIDATDFV